MICWKRLSAVASVLVTVFPYLTDCVGYDNDCGDGYGNGCRNQGNYSWNVSGSGKDIAVD